MATKAKKKPQLSSIFTPGTFMQIQPCPARGKWDDSIFDDPNFYFEEKVDGDRRVGQVVERAFRLTGRTVSELDGLFVEKTDRVPHITMGYDPETLHANDEVSWSGSIDKALAKRMALLDGTILDGECVISQQQIDAIVASGERVGGLSKKCTSIMGSRPGAAVAKQMELGWMRWVIFDCLAYKGKDIRGLKQLERREYAIKAVAELGNPYITMAPAAFGKDKRKFLADIMAKPFGEGIIAKRVDALYGQEKLWVKNKLTENHDCVIMGFDPPEEFSRKTSGIVSVTKLFQNGWIGAVQIGQYLDGKLTQMGTISGMDEPLRIDLTHNPDKYLGKVVQIECNGREPTLAFRHPRWDGLRDDKRPEECIYYPEEC